MGNTIVVVPCYNEGRRLPITRFQEFCSSERGVQFLFVDDGSTDSTGELLKSLSAGHPELFRVVCLPENRGKAEAVRYGFLQAFHFQADYVGFWDADLASPLEAVLSFRAILDKEPEIEMVFGSRVRLCGRAIERRPMRHYLGRAFATLVSFLLGIPIYDTQCGAKLFRVSPMLKEIFQEPFITRWIFDVEIIARAIQCVRRDTARRIDRIIYEFPLMEWRDVAGSKLSSRHFLRAAYDLVRVHRRYMR